MTDEVKREGSALTGRTLAPGKSEDKTDRGPSRRADILLYFWSLAACVSVAQGIHNSLKPGQSQDLHLVYGWLSTWLWQGFSPYYLPRGLTANYPPYALAYLSPLALIPERNVAWAWSAFNVVLAPVAALIAFRYIAPEARLKAARLPCVMFLSWAGLRIGLGDGQFSLLMLTCGLLAVATVRKRPYPGGLCLALSLMKPHIGAAFFLWAVLTKRFKAATVCTGVVVAGWFIFSFRLGESPLAVAQGFLYILRQQFGGATFLGGVIELRPLIHFIIPAYSLAEIVHLIILLAALAAVGGVGLWHTPRAPAARNIAVLQLSCLWVSMSVFHNPYDTIMLLPLMVGLQSARMPQSAPSTRRTDFLALWILQLALVMEVPGTWWKLSARFDLSAFGWAGAWLSHFDRVIVAGLFVYVLYRVRRLCRIAQQGEAVHAGTVHAPAPAMNS